MNIAIVGAGIGGLATAILLERLGHRISLFEQFRKPVPIGSGLMIQPVGLEVLEQAGVADVVLKHATPIKRVLGSSSQTGRRVLDVDYGAVPGLGIHRAALFSALYEKVLTRALYWRTDCRITGHQDGKLRFADGSFSEAFDLIIDASGANSVLSPLKARALSFGAIWGTVDWVSGGLPEDHLSQRYRGADHMIGVLPVGLMPGQDRRKAAFFWSLRQDAYEDWLKGGLAAWKDTALSIWPDAGPFLEQITDPEQMTMARYSHGTLRQPWGTGLPLLVMPPTGRARSSGRARTWLYWTLPPWQRHWRPCRLTRLSLPTARPDVGTWVSIRRSARCSRRPIKVTAGCCPFCATMCCFLSAVSRPFPRCCRI